MKRIVSRNLMIVLGTLCIVLGVVGMLLPVLPTTPFLLLAAFFYVRSSPRFYNWLITNRWFGRYIRNYREGKGIPLLQKILSISLLWLSIGYATFFVVDKWWIRLPLIGIAVGVSVHIIRIKKYIKEEIGQDNTEEQKEATSLGN